MHRLQSLCENSKLARFCSARLQAGTLKSSRCPPEGGRYMKQNRVLTQALQPAVVSQSQDQNPLAEACATSPHMEEIRRLRHHDGHGKY